MRPQNSESKITFIDSRNKQIVCAMQHFEHKKTPDELAPVWTKGERLEPEKATGRK